MQTYGAGKPDTLKSPWWDPKKKQRRATTNDLLNQLRFEMWATSLKKTHSQPLSPSTASDQSGPKCDHPLTSAIFLSVK